MGLNILTCCCEFAGPYFEVATTTLVDDTPDPDEVRIVGRSTLDGTKSDAGINRFFAEIDADIPNNAEVITSYNHAWLRWHNDDNTEVTYMRVAYNGGTGAVSSITLDTPYVDGTQPDPDDPTSYFDDWVIAAPYRVAWEHLFNTRRSVNTLLPVDFIGNAGGSYQMSHRAIVKDGAVIVPRYNANLRAYSNLAADYYYAINIYERLAWDGDDLTITSGYAPYTDGGATRYGEDGQIGYTPSDGGFAWEIDTSDTTNSYAYAGSLTSSSDIFAEDTILGTYERDVNAGSSFSNANGYDTRPLSNFSRDGDRFFAGITHTPSGETQAIDLFVGGNKVHDKWRANSTATVRQLVEDYYDTHDPETEWPPPIAAWPDAGDSTPTNRTIPNELDEITDYTDRQWYDHTIEWGRALDNNAGSDVVICFGEFSVQQTGSAIFGFNYVLFYRKRLEFWSGSALDKVTFSAPSTSLASAALNIVFAHGNFVYVHGSLWHFAMPFPPTYFAISNDGEHYFDCEDSTQWWRDTVGVDYAYGIPYDGTSGLPDWAEPPIDFSELEVNPTP